MGAEVNIKANEAYIGKENQHESGGCVYWERKFSKLCEDLIYRT